MNKKKRWKGLRDVIDTFQWYSEGDENKVDKITKSSRGIVIWGRNFERQKIIFFRNLLARGVNWFVHDWLMQQGSTMWSWPIISDSFLKCVNETFVKGEMSCSQKQAIITNRSLPIGKVTPNFSRERWLKNYVQSNCDENKKSPSTYYST